MGKIVLKSVRKSFGEVDVIPQLDLTIEDGEFVVFVGPSGCGKSTLLRLIAGLEDMTSGTMHIDARDVTAAPPSQRGLAMVFQSYALYPHMTVRKNIAFPLKMAGLPQAEQDAKVEAAAKVLNLGSYLDRRPGQLSGGQRQRVAIGRAIVREPSAFLFDEPLSNLDAKLRVQMRTEIRELHQRLKTTTVYVTHDQIEAMTMADKIVVLNAGRIEQVGSPLELYNKPANTFVAGFIGSPKMNLIEGVAKDGRFTAPGLDLPLPPGAADGRRVTYGIRPEHLALTSDGTQAQIVVVEPTGAEIHLVLRAGEQELVAVVRERQAFKPGQVLHVTPDLSQVHLFDTATGERIG